MAPIKPPRTAPCCTCRRWWPQVGRALGACDRVPRSQWRDAEGRLVRSSHTAAGDQFACHEAKAVRR